MWPRYDGLRTLELGCPGEMRTWLTDLVRSGTKRATFGLLEHDYAAEGEPVEHVGEILVVLDDEGRDACRVRVVEVRECAFSEITWEMASREGEGDADLDEWRAGHLRFWTGEGIDITPDTRVAWIAFTLA
jgi:uncharacterized protein YhfF